LFRSEHPVEVCQVLQPITDAAHLVHGPIAFEGNSWDSRNSASSGPMLYRTSFTTNLSEFDIIQAARRSFTGRSARWSARRYDPPAVFAYAACDGVDGGGPACSGSGWLLTAPVRTNRRPQRREEDT
jgi:hypothetical protein